MNTEQRQGRIDDLRSFLDWLEANPSVRFPGVLADTIYQAFPSVEELRDAVALLDKPLEKQYSDQWLEVTKKWGGLQWTMVVERGRACTARVVGHEVKRQTVLISPAVYEEQDLASPIIEWDCAPLLGSQ